VRSPSKRLSARTPATAAKARPEYDHSQAPASTLDARLDTAVRTTIGLLVLPPALVLASCWVMLLVLIGGPPAWIDHAYIGFARFALWVAGTRVEVHGIDHLQPGQAYVVVPNHESDWDPVVLMAALRQLRLRAVIKEQVARIPLFGPALLRTGNVRVERTDTATDVQRLREAMAARRPDVSMLFYAEGTRSRDGALHEFRKGAFVTAIGYQLPILPVGTAGTRRVWPPLTLRLRSGSVVVEIGPAIPVADRTLDDRDRLRDETREAVRELRAAARRRLRALGVEPGGSDD
jgi:1-acyl-sn-glycerol-3-phosphate acyltransferase